MISLGISGHRSLGDGDNVDRVRALVRDQFESLRARLAEYGQPIQFLLISPLAEGADRVFVEAIWSVAPRARLLVPLPFAKDEYEKSFADHASVDRFNALLGHPNCLECFELPRGVPGEYLEVGKFIIDHADIVFFLHDGSDVSGVGLDGGTSSVIRYAEHRGRCLIADGGAGAGQGRLHLGALHGLPHPHEQLVAVYINISSLEARVVTSYGGARTVEFADMDGFFREIWDEPSASLPRPGRVGNPGGLGDVLQGLSGDRLVERARHYRRLLLSGWALFLVLGWLASVLPLLGWAEDWAPIGAAGDGLLGWAGVGLSLLAGIGALWLTYSRNAPDARIVGLEYLADRLGYLGLLLQAAMPISWLLVRGREDPAGRALKKRWQSIYYDCYLRSGEPLHGSPEAPRLKALLTSSEGWARRRLDGRLIRMLRMRRFGLRLRLLGRSLFLIATAGLFGLTVTGLLGDGPYRELVGVLPVGVGLALVALGAYGLGKRFAAQAESDARESRRLAALQTGALFTVFQDPATELMRLRVLIDEFVEGAMNGGCERSAWVRPDNDTGRRD